MAKATPNIPSARNKRAPGELLLWAKSPGEMLVSRTHQALKNLPHWPHWHRSDREASPSGGEHVTKRRATRQGVGLQPCPPPTRLTSASHLLGTAVGQPLLAVAVKATGTSAGGNQEAGGVMGLTEKPSPPLPSPPLHAVIALQGEQGRGEPTQDH